MPNETKKYYGNTYMLTSTEFKKITPNDLACLISLYADENCDMEKMKAELFAPHNVHNGCQKHKKQSVYQGVYL